MPIDVIDPMPAPPTKESSMDAPQPSDDSAEEDES